MMLARHSGRSVSSSSSSSTNAAAKSDQATSTADVPTFSFGHDLTVSGTIGIGTWAWGAKQPWGWTDEMEADAKAAFEAAADEGISFFDTAEVYGDGKSEELLGKFVRESGRARDAFVLATKFLPLPSYWRASALAARFEASAARLATRVDVYQVHGMLPSARSVETWCAELARLHAAGRIRAVGVSNFTAPQLRRAHAALAAAGVPLVANQIEYSLLRRAPETSGLIAACQQLGVRVIAYSPLGMGRLTGKYSSKNPPPARAFGNVPLAELDALLDTLNAVAAARSCTPAQVALAWLIAKGAFPIAGARNAAQARENAGAMRVRLGADDIEALDAASARAQARPSLFTRLWQD